MMIKFIAFILLTAFLTTSSFADDTDYCRKNCDANLKSCHAEANETANRQLFSWDGTVYGMERVKKIMEDLPQPETKTALRIQATAIIVTDGKRANAE